MNLHKQIADHPNDLNNIATQVTTYYQVYESLIPYKQAMKQYIDHHSRFFKSGKDADYEARLEVETELYASHYALLSAEDKEKFLEPDQQLRAESYNIRRF